MLQGRQWLPKTWGASSNASRRRAAARRRLLFCQNLGGNCPLCPPAIDTPAQAGSIAAQPAPQKWNSHHVSEFVNPVLFFLKSSCN